MGKEFHGWGGNINNNDQTFGVLLSIEPAPLYCSHQPLGGKQDEEQNVGVRETAAAKRRQGGQARVTHGQMHAISFEKPFLAVLAHSDLEKGREESN